MQIAQRLAWIEWYRSFRFMRKDNHDFFWLTSLLFLTLSLALLLWGTRGGLLNKFIDISLGHIPQTGIPIWVAAHQSSGIDRALLHQTDITFHPYREVESIQVALPEGMDIWHEKMAAFTGWAVALTDPLWRNAAPSVSPTTVPLEIILNKDLLTQSFNCTAYIKAIQKHLPLTLITQPTLKDPLACLTATNTILLNVNVGTEKRELLPFHIHWQQRIPTMHPLAFLLPLSTFYALQVSNYFPGLNYYPEAQHSKTNRIKELMVWADTVDPWLQQLKACLGAGERQGARLIFSYPLPSAYVMQCLQKSHLPLKTAQMQPPYALITEAIESHYFQYNNDYLTVRCPETQSQCRPCTSFLQAPAWRSLKNTICTPTQTTANMFELFGGYQAALTYVKDRHQLAAYLEVVEHLKTGANQPVFYLHPTYRDAYVRFLFIQKVVDMLKLVYGPLFLCFLFVLLWVQLGFVITHRRHHYGILLAKGMARRHLYQMILLQLTLSFAVALISVFLVLEIIRDTLNQQFTSIVTQKPYINHIIAGDFDLLPLSGLDYALISLITLTISYFIAAQVFRYTVPLKRIEPAYLFRF